MRLLIKDPAQRLGVAGAGRVKTHTFFATLDWKGLLRRKAEFVPQLAGDEDTSYFDSRADRYYHEDGGSEEDDEDEDSDVSGSSSLFHSFCSSSPRYSRICSMSRGSVSAFIRCSFKRSG